MRSIIAAVALALSVTGVLAQPVCNKREDMVAVLENEFQEKLTSVGVINQEVILEVYASESGSFTILSTDVHGNACMIVGGENWELVETPKGKEL